MSRIEPREKRHKRIRKKILGTEGRPRLCVFKSNRYIYAQIIDDTKGTTLAGASSLEKEVKAGNINCEVSKQVGLLIGKRAAEKGIIKIVFDRGGYQYHGNVKSLAEGVRESGIQF